MKYKSWYTDYEYLYSGELALAPLAYLEYLQDDAPITMSRRESDLHRLHQYFSRCKEGSEGNQDQDRDEDDQPWEKGPVIGLQQFLSGVADTKTSGVADTVVFEVNPDENWSSDYDRLGGGTTFAGADRWLDETIRVHSKTVKDANASADAKDVIDVSTLNCSQAVALATLQEYESKGEQLLMLVYGPGGSGKSHLIKCIKQQCEGVFVMAPTAMAAMLVGGVTYQSAIPVPVNGCRTYPTMSAAVREYYKELLRGIKTLLLEEFSMLSHEGNGWIDLRLRQIFEVRKTCWLLGWLP